MTDGIHFTETEFWNTVLDDVYGPREGGAVLIFDAENARKGVGKTSAAVFFARAFSRAFGFEIGEADLVISGENYLSRLEEHPGEHQPSVVVWDEAVGGGSGDSRRSMAEENRVMGQAWQMLRTKRVVSLVTLPDWNALDSRLQKLADYRLWCREQPIGVVQPYKVTTPFNASSGNDVKTRGLGPDTGARGVWFPDMKGHGDPLYHAIAAKKDQLIDARGTFDANDALAADGGEDPEDPEEAADRAKREQALRTAIRAVKPWDDDAGMSYTDAAKLIDYSSSWVGNRADEFREGHHRDVMPDGFEVSPSQ